MKNTIAKTIEKTIRKTIEDIVCKTFEQIIDFTAQQAACSIEENPTMSGISVLVVGPQERPLENPIENSKF